MNVEQVYLQLVAAMDDVADKLTKRGNNIFDEKNVNLFADGRVYRFGMKYTF
ncbi:hypothetical protein SELR_pSRC101750 (plasmid) [Selenomonas ruminantium subsp. lactilytica TAM6421]|uniref:Uncharacterized protein n=1 Tax=Selenomonas ruminantium subsp. lactilytica (strain NBRC 103574 / TAM6421) TaxID=927704 RepID=I0GW45_SELRL|nr:hypothetical protein [Selenomonas ruminantium]BAL84982.1 hypothetical protein SELR_pSRC101750 [Selenomonas ruminantium subsp. lactilytica TAM6421]